MSSDYSKIGSLKNKIISSFKSKGSSSRRRPSTKSMIRDTEESVSSRNRINTSHHTTIPLFYSNIEQSRKREMKLKRIDSNWQL